jgi:hypothetical protein
MNLTDYIAIYAAILSSMAIAWNIYIYYKDKPIIKVIGKFGFIGSSNGAEGPFFFVDAINFGRRPITLSSMGLRCGDNDLINIHSIGLPRELGEGKSHSEFFDIKSLKGKDWDFAWYKDETGKLYKSKSIKKKLQNYFKSENQDSVKNNKS